MPEALAVTKTQYTVVDFLEWQRQGTLELRPYYQRRSVWNPRVKSLLIDSLLRGYPLPLIFLHSRLDVDTSMSMRRVVDGQQRLRTILSFIDHDCIPDQDEWDRFTVLRSHNREFAGLSFQQLPSEIQTRLLQTPLSVNVLPADVGDVTILTIFQRMNTTGLKLNAQEIRNATGFGEFKDAASSRAYEQYQRWLKWDLFDVEDSAQMKEVELTSDLMGALMRGVSARSKAAIDGLYKNFDASFPERDEVADKFRAACDFMDEVYSPGKSNSGLRRFRSASWVYSIFLLAAKVPVPGVPETALAQLTPESLIERLERAEVRLRSPGELDDETLKVLRGATAHKRSRELRTQFLMA